MLAQQIQINAQWAGQQKPPARPLDNSPDGHVKLINVAL